jgi:hypothetical protein
MDTKFENVLKTEIELLKSVLDEINPNWEIETMKALQTDENGLISESVCLPIRAAIILISPKEE